MTTHANRLLLCGAALIVTIALAGCPDEKLAGIGGSCGSAQDCQSGICSQGGLCLDPDGDEDFDSLSNGVEATTLGSDPENPDTDGDGMDDGAEVAGQVTNAPDSDGDGKPDWFESLRSDLDGDCIPDQLDARDEIVDDDFQFLTADYCPQTGVCVADGASLAVRCDDEDIVACVFADVPDYEADEVSCDALDNDCDGEVDEGLAPCEAQVVALAADAEELTVPFGRSAQITVLATYDDDASVDVTADATWTSDDEDVVTVAAGAIATIAQGTTTVHAAFDGFTAEVTVTVGPPAVDAVAIASATSVVSTAHTTSLTLEAQYSDGSSEDVTDEATWSSDDEDVATVSAGLVTGVTVGEVTITASFEGVEDQTSVTIVVDGCDEDPCDNGGTCVSDGQGGQTCDCAAGYEGETCGVNIDDCADAPCQNNGDCQDGVDSFTCACPNGWTGDLCEIEVNGCDSAPCQHGGTCSDQGAGAYTCSCPDAWTGDHCDVDVNECEGDAAPCDVHADCANTAGGFTCTCQDGWSGTGTFCANVNECLEGSDDCLEIAACEDTLGGYTCTCPDGYTGDGVTACDDVDECDAGTAGCDVNATCDNTAGGATCTCKPGYAGDGTSCADIDECAQGTDDCHANADCGNTVGGFTCTCKDGYSGDGVAACDDVNECTTGEAGCDPNASCANTAGGAVCTCNDGWAGDGTTCSNVNECLQGIDDCLDLATCEDTNGGFACTCKNGYSGDGVTSCDDVNECDEQLDDCDANATCANTVGSYSCSCDPGYSGDGRTCLDVDECANETDDCDVNATCANTDGAWTCTCDAGYSGSGTSCTNIDDCASQPCQNGGVCVDGVADFTCQCPTGFAGELCEINVNGCQDSPCQHGGECTDGVDPPFTCACPDGYTGTLCELNVNECATGDHDCDGNATCADTDGSYVCTCKAGWQGDGTSCVNVNECADATDNCSDDATCTDTPGSFTCACNDGYTGDGVVCSNVNECQEGSHTCDTHASCADTDGGYTCTCDPGWAGSGESCSNVNECQQGTDSCDDHATCGDTQGGYTCTCKPGWTGDGETCSNVDECQQGTDGCSDDATCTDTPGSYTCDCKPGYEGNGVVCDDVDECQTIDGVCDPHATCANNAGSYTCTCDPGWSGDGDSCTDVNECQTGADDCDTNATCTNTQGGFTCACDEGWIGSGKTCSDLNECQTGAHDCDPNASCSNTPGGWTCDCDEGWSGTGQSCSDVNECQTGAHDCDAHATCGNTPGGWTCDCDEGWTGDGQSCSDVDECVTGGDDCDPNATCTNTPGGWDCACDPGWTGTGQVCGDVDECSTGGHDCDTNATCTNTDGGWTCECDPGWTGTGQTCADLNECAGQGGGHDCDPNADGTNVDGGWECECRAGYSGTGAVCSDDDECEGEGVGHDCDTNASCTNTPGSWSCECAPGFFGDGTSCTACTPVDQCAGQVVCTSADDSVCQDCADGYELSDGQCVDIDECALDTDQCPITATCTNTPGGFTCTDCPAGYENGGQDSCVDIDECDRGSDDCAPVATCTNTAGGWTCACPSGTWGPGTSCTDCTPVAHCTSALTCTSASDSRCTACAGGYEVVNGVCKDVDECALESDDCGDTQTCANTDGSYVCEDCAAGYWNDPDDGLEACVDVDECATGADDCDDNATCGNTVGGFACACDDGYFGDGKSCTTCTPVPNCKPGQVTCTHGEDSKCHACEAGYALDDYGLCIDIDECDPPDGNGRCEPEVERCVNTDGGFTCKVCQSGYWNDPDDQLESCVDIDECATGGDDCDARATCENTDGGWTCTCRDGYWGSGQTCTACTAVPGCRSGQVRCTTADDSTCLSCQGGYELDPNTGWCNDVDECAQNSDNCGADEICQNTPGGFTCAACPAGYENGGDDTCVDIDECQTGGHDCASPGGVCRNTPGSWACECYPGYTGPTCGDQEPCTLYVAEGSDGDGSSWESAAPSLAKLPDFIGPLCDVWVAKGVYTNPDGGTAPVLWAWDGVGYYGGFAGGETSLGERDPDGNPTILDGQDNVYNVVVLADGATVDGFSITRGYARNTSTCGGGVLFKGVGQAALTGCKIFDNAAQFGGGICVTGGSEIVIDDVEVSANTASRTGGGVDIFDTGKVTVKNALIYDNTGALGGAGIEVHTATDVRLERVTLNNNATVFSGSTRGGGLFVDVDSSVVGQDLRLRTNQADYGGGLAVASSSAFEGTNVVVADNTGNKNGGNLYVEGGLLTLLHATVTAGHARAGTGLHCFGGGAVYVDASILWANDDPGLGGECEELKVTNSITTLNGEGNIPEAPLWVKWPTDLRLWSGSPAIDRVATDAVDADIRGLPRLPVSWGGELPHDMGAYEFQEGPSPRDPYLWFVHQHAQGEKTGLSWLDAFNTLEQAFEVARAGDAIWVAGLGDVGITYRPESFGTGADSTFVMPEGVAMYGGFDGNDPYADFAGRAPGVYRTILSCDYGEQGTGDSGCGHVLTIATDTVVDGFVVRGGYVGEGGNNPHGAGIVGRAVGTTTLANLFLVDNTTASGHGGGLYIKGCDAVSIDETVFQNNHATGEAGGGGGGGGMAIEDCPEVVMTTGGFTGNTAIVGGGFYLLDSAGAELRRVTIVKNHGVPSAGAQGTGWGGAFASAGTLLTTNTLIADNTAAVAGPGGVVLGGQTTLYFTTVAGHRGQSGSLQVNAGVLAVKNSVVWPTEATGPDIGLVQGQVFADFSDIAGSPNACGAVWTCSEVYDVDPIFEAPAALNYRLNIQSPLVDKAAPDESVADDLDGTARPQLGGWDMGCYEAQEK